MNRSAIFLVLAGALAVVVIGAVATLSRGPALVARLDRDSRAALVRAGAGEVQATFRTEQGWLTRHPRLSGGDGLPDSARERAVAALAAVPGVGGIQWRQRPGAPRPVAESGAGAPLHCQQEVEGVLRVRSIRFDEASAAIAPASATVLDEVATALRPCVGSIIAVIGHTDDGGAEPANLTLSRQRADAVRLALIARGIPADGLRAAGKGSSQPLHGVAPDDPANRRIEFSVIESVPIRPTAVDVPGAG